MVKEVCAFTKLGTKEAKSIMLDTIKFLQKRRDFLDTDSAGLAVDKGDEVDV
jgi:hypothetical protein